MTDTPENPPPPPSGAAPPPPPAGGAPPPPPAQPPSGGPPAAPPPSSNRKLMLILSYLGILSLVPLLTEKDDKEIQWHAKNGLGIFIAAILVGILVSVIENMVLGSGFIGCFLSCAFAIIVLGVTITAIMKALAGDKLRLPVISDFADK